MRGTDGRGTVAVMISTQPDVEPLVVRSVLKK
jgi:hypothetical protein